jgi:1-phosphofructokinase family hexose kinase
MINTLTLNPAIDRIIYLEALRKNVTNRIEGVTEVLGGKGTHVSINLRLLGLPNRAFGICHGDTGRRIIRFLEEEGVAVEFIHREGASSRTNYLLVERDNDCTIIAEKGVPLEQEDLDEVIDSLVRLSRTGDSLVLSGDAGNCPDPFVYKTIMDGLRDKAPRVFVDTSGPALAKCMEGGPFLIKPNLGELSFLCGRELSCEVAEILAAIDSLDAHGVEIVAVSLGGGGSILKCPEGVYRAIPPPVRVRNTIGCGDSYLAGLVYGISEGRPIAETLAIATAASAATAESSLSVGFDQARARELVAACEVRRLR